jgi:hypothetical protein
MQPIDQFQRIARQATSLLSQTSNAPDVVPFGQSLLKLIEDHPDQRRAFGHEFVIGIQNRSEFDPWVMAFCMHALRWPELKVEFEAMSAAAVARNDWNLIQPLGHILDAFEDEWPDAKDFYASYFYPTTGA